METQNIRPLILYVALLFFLFMMLRITLPYLALHDEVGFLRIKHWVIDNLVWKGAFYVHVFSSSFLLLAGFTQFSSWVMRRYPRLHKTAGKAYLAILLFVSAPAGFVMGLYANGGIPAQIAFLLLSLLWIWFSWKAWKTVRARDFEGHGKWMVRSFALTLSALTLRGWKFVLVMTLHPRPMDLYMVVAWLGFIPNLLIAEWLIRKGWHLRVMGRRL